MSKRFYMVGTSVLTVAMCGAVPALAQSASATAPAAAPSAATPADASAADIVVTAQRRSERLQNVPVVVTAISADTLTQKGVISTSDLAVLTPGLTNFVANGFVMPSLRGVGSQNNAAGSTGTVAVYLDGVYIASPQAALLGYNNIQQVEVDKGPQGTLFGRNATAGVIQIKTKDPSSIFGGRVGISGGSYSTVTGDLYLTGPLATNLAADIAIHYSDQGRGYGTNLYTGNDVYKTREFDVRSKLLWTPSPNDRILATVDYEKLTDSSDAIQFNGVPYDYFPGGTEKLQSQLGNPWNYWASMDPTDRGKQWGASLEVQHSFPWGTITNIAAYRRSDDFILSTAAVAPYDILALQEHAYKQTSDELRLSSPEGSKIAWVAGFYYLNSTATNEPYTFVGSGSATFTAPTACTARFCPPYFPVGPLSLVLGSTTAPAQFGPFPPNSNAFNTYVTSNSGSESYAGFAQTTIPLDGILPSLKITAGIRYTSETVSLSGTDAIKFPGVTVVQPDTTFSKLTYKAGIDYHFTPDIMGYATYSRGFQAGFFNANVPKAAASAPQTIDDFEVGFKSSFFDHRLILNAGGFYYNYKNIVEPVVIAGVPNTTNGPKARLYGVDIDASLSLSSRLNLSVSSELLHTEWTSFPGAATALPATAATPNGFCNNIYCNPLGGVVSKIFDATGNQLPYAPKFVLTVSPSYRLPVGTGSILLGGDWYHNSGYYNDASNIYGQRAYDTFSAYAEWKPGSGDFSVRIWGKNLSNQVIYARMSTSAPFSEFYALSAPRTWGITLDHKF